MPKIILRAVLIIVVVFGLLAPYFPTFADVNADVFVPPRASDFQFTTSITPDSPTYAQDDEFEFKITYGSSLNFAAPMTIVGQWSQGTIQGQPSPSEDILDYVVSSATTAYGGTQPVVDTINRTVTWTVSSFPAQLDNQTINFHLKTNFNYTASQNVSFTVGAYLTNSGTTVNAADITRNYHYDSSGPSPTPTPTPTSTPTPTPGPTGTPTPTPTPGPTSTPGPEPTSSPSTSTSTSTTPTSTPTPTPTPQPFAIKTVSIRTVSDSSATIYVTTNEKSKSRITYGTSSSLLNQSVLDDSFSLEHQMTLSDLSPSTKYFFKVTAFNQGNKTSVSDIFAAKTAAVSEAPAIAVNTFTVTSANKILVSPTNSGLNNLTMQEQRTLVIPQATVYDLRFSLAKTKPIKSVKAFLRKKISVLGANTSILAQLFDLNNQNNYETQNNPFEMPSQTEPSNVNVREVSLTEIQPGIYYGRLISNLPIGEYELFAVAADSDGNISETKLSDVKVVSRFTTLSKDTKQPIENARIYLSFYNPGTKKYESLLPTLISITNPSFTDSRGELPLVLPQGKYQALVSDLGYKDKTVNFVIGVGKTDGFPIVYLEKEGFNLLSSAVYYGRTIRDVYIYYTLQYFTALSKSLRYFNLINAATLGLFVIVTLLSFKFRTHIPLGSIFSYLIYHLRKMGGKNISAFYLEGIILDEKTKKPISKAQVYLIDSNTHQTIRQTSTNVNGHFFFKLDKHENYEILTVKKGYEITPVIEAARETYTNTPIKISLRKSESKIGVANTLLTRLVEMPIGFLFEYLLMSSLISEVASIPYFGLTRTLPFIAISGFNFLLWALHLKQKSQSKKMLI